MSNIILQSERIQCFTENEILMNIKPEILKDILAKDEHPFFQTYVLAHEGKSKPRIIGVGGQIINWGRKAIQSIKTVIKSGLKCFKGHNSDNSTDNRKSYGEIVGYTEREINGKLNGIIITYHSPDIKEEAKNLDVCSQEAIWDIEDNNGELNAIACNEITGVAFENSKNERPAFADAKRLASIQCFENEAENKEVKKMIFSELKKTIEELNVFPSQLFKLEDVKNDKNFMTVFNDYETKIKEATVKATDFETKFKEIEKNTQKLTSKDRLEKLIMSLENKLTDKEKEFVVKSLDLAEDVTDTGLKSFIDKQRTNYKISVSLNDIKTPDANKTTIENKEKDYTSNKDNDLLN
jgi:hypothetical protein